MRTLLLIPLLFALPAPALAQEADPSCFIRVTGLNFGLYSSLDPGHASSLGRIEVDCFPPAETAGLKVTLSAGRSGQPLDRVMTHGDAELRYNLYADPARHRVLGDGSNGTVTPAQTTRALGRANFRVYGVIWARQAVPAGEYSDTVRIEIEF